jgi:hypothetical protein
MEITIIGDVFPPGMLAVIRKFYLRFVRTLNTIACDPAVKMGITTSCLVNLAAVNDSKSNENFISSSSSSLG